MCEQDGQKGLLEIGEGSWKVSADGSCWKKKKQMQHLFGGWMWNTDVVVVTKEQVTPEKGAGSGRQRLRSSARESTAVGWQQNKVTHVFVAGVWGTCARERRHMAAYQAVVGGRSDGVGLAGEGHFYCGGSLEKKHHGGRKRGHAMRWVLFTHKELHYCRSQPKELWYHMRFRGTVSKSTHMKNLFIIRERSN